MRRLSLIFTVVLILACEAFACTCDDEGDFLDVSSSSKLVVLVKVVGFPVLNNLFSRTNVAMEVEVIKVYRGNESRRTITIWGDNGSLCRPYVSEFLTGQQYLLSLNPGSDDSGNTFESVNDYSISICGEHWLLLHKSGKYRFIVTGEQGRTKEYGLEHFEIELRKKNGQHP